MRPRPSLRKRLRRALARRRKRLLYPLLATGRGPLADPAEVDFGNVRRVLLLRELNTVGDSLLATPAVRALKQAHPHLELAMVAGRRNAALWRHNPRLARLFVLRGGFRALRLRDVVREVRRWQPQVAITIESWTCHATLDLVAGLSGAPVRIRYDGAAFGMPHTNAGYTCLVPCPYGRTAHQIEVCAGVLRPFGVELAGRALELVPGVEAERVARRILAEATVDSGAPFVVVHPGSKQLYNRWPLERFLAVYEHCRRARGVRALLSFGPHEKEARQWLRAAGAEARDLLPTMSVAQLVALLRAARLLVCPDTGVLHLGAAAGVPIVGLYGSGDPRVWQPPGPIRAVSDHARGNVRDIPVEAVLREVDAALGWTLPEIRLPRSAV